MFNIDIYYHNIPMLALDAIDSVKSYLRQAALESASWEMVAIAVNSSTVLIERVDRFLMNGQPIALPVMGMFEGRGGKIAAWLDYLDLTDYQRQLAAAAGKAS